MPSERRFTAHSMAQTCAIILHNLHSCFCEFLFHTCGNVFHFVFVFGVEQVKNKSNRRLLRKRVSVGGHMATCMRRPRWMGKKVKDKGTFFQVCFPFTSPPEAQSVYELAGLFLKSGGLSALQKQHWVPKKLEGRVIFFHPSVSSLFKNSENYSKSSPLFLCAPPRPLPLHPLVSLPLDSTPPSWSFPADKHGSE